MMGTIRPGYINVGFQCLPHRDTSQAINKLSISIPNDEDNPMLKMPHSDTSLAIQQAIYRSQMMETIRLAK